MSEVSDRIFISIAVSKPRGGLVELPGAITAAERMAAWAQAQGYETLLLHDRDLPEITIELLRDRITEVIKGVTDEIELKRLVIFFAGHGAALAIGDQYWILTNWQQRPTEAIKVSSLQRMLEYYGPRQVSVIGDACQEFSSKFIDLLGSAVLDMPAEEQHPYELDQFFAVDVGKQAFMIKAEDDKKDFCLFTEVLLDALEGDSQEICFEEIGGDKVVTSQSLARYLDNNVTREASKYGVRMIPRPKPGFYTDRAYLTMPAPPDEDLPPFWRSWMESAALRKYEGLGPRLGSSDGSSQRAEPGPEPSQRAEPGPEPSQRAEPGPEPRQRPEQREKAAARSRTISKAKLLTPESPKVPLNAQIEALDLAREASRAAFINEVGRVQVRDHFKTGCGICVSGADVAEVEASFGEVSRVDEPGSWFRINLNCGDADSLGWSDTLVTLQDGRVVPVCAVNNFVGVLHIIDEVSLSLFHRPLGAYDYEGQQAIDLLALAHAGQLSPQVIINTALMLRFGKHRIITLGCIAAQFYDTIRDVDSLRSMAAFYALNHQPVPLDIILYGGGTISEFGGRLYADIPAVAAREPRTPEERGQSFTFANTPGFEGHPIAGRIPWMRQGWGAVATANCDASAGVWREQAIAAMKFLAPGIFTVAIPDGHKALTELAGITVHTGEYEPLSTLS
jgi:hypothetical protein